MTDEDIKNFFAYSFDGYAPAYGDYRYYQPFSGVANNYVGMRSNPSFGNRTSGTVRSAAPPTGSGGTCSSGRVCQFQHHRPY